MAAGQTVVVYNNVTIRNCLTRRFVEECVRDDSDTDIVYHKFTVRVVGFVYGGTTENANAYATSPESSSNSAAAHHKNVRHALLEPRKDFDMRLGASSGGLGGTILLRARPATRVAYNDPSLFDVNNGPKPRVIEVTRFAGDHLLRVEFEIEVCVLQCDEDGNANSNASGVLSNRWTVTDEIDENFYTTRTWSGRLRAVASIRNPNEFRHFVLPPLQDGMQRKSMNYQVTTDGLNLDYRIVDKEVAWSAPAPATSWSFTHTESYGESALTQFGDVNITLAGDRDVDKRKLIAIGAEIINSMLFGGNFEKNSRRLVSLTITDSYGNNQQNSIHMYARVRRFPSAKQEDGDKAIKENIENGLARLGRPIKFDDLKNTVDSYDANKSRGGRDGESVESEGPIPMVSAFHCYLQTSCDGTHEFGKSEQSGESGDPQSLSTPQISAREVPELTEDDPTYLSEEHQTNLYEYWRLDSEYSQDSLKVQLPLAKASGSTEQTSAVVNLGAGTAKRIVRVRGERMGKYPQMPLALDYTDSNGIAHTLLRRVDIPSSPPRGPDGSQLFTIRSEFHFALDRLPPQNARLDVGRNPWESVGLHRTDSDTFQGPSVGGTG